MKKKSAYFFQTRQYMGHARKQLFFGREAYPLKTYPMCNSSGANPQLDVQIKCKQQQIHALITKRHNKVVWEQRKLVLSTKISRHYTLINARNYNKIPQENIVPTWLLLCTCGMQRYHCTAKFRQDILCVIGHPYNHPPLEALAPYLTIQFIEFTYRNDRFATKTLARKTTKYQPLINNIISRGWNVASFMVLVACARATTHIMSMKTWKQN